VKPTGFLGIDSNLENVTVADSSGDIVRYSVAKVAEIKSQYRQVKSHFTRNDVRVKRTVWGKYGQRERRRVDQALHKVSAEIVKRAERGGLGIGMEKLTGIRRLYSRRNNRGVESRFRLNSWSFAELQRKIEYKALWAGVPVIYVNPRGTSTECSKCGRRMKPEENRKQRCACCGLEEDRDVNAARNILARAVRFAAVAPQVEAMQVSLQEGAKSIAAS